MSAGLEQKGPLPIVVAVTGHTDLRDEDKPRLTEKIRALFEELRTTYPHSPIELLTPLAEGADRIAASVALECGATLTVVLPLEESDYKTDFRALESIREFDELRARAARVFALPQTAETSRPDCYVRVGAYCVQHSHLLLALWDGVDTGKAGGTSEIVRFCLEGVPRRFSGSARLLNPPDTGVVHHIVTPRLSASRPDEPFQSRWGAADGGEAEARAVLDELLGSTERFNQNALQRGIAEEAARSSRDLGPDPGVLTPIVDAYGWADALALRFQRKSYRAIKTLFVVGWLSIVAFEAFTDLQITIAVVPYVLLFLLALALYVWITSRGLDDRHLDYRSLAEALRVHFYWRVAGISDSVSDHYMRYRIPESEWIRKALLVVESRLDAATTPSAAALADVTRDWVQAQSDFYTRAEGRDHTLHHRLDRAARVLMIASMALLLWLIGISVLEMLERKPIEAVGEAHEEHGGHHGLVVLIGVAAAAAGAIHGYGEKRALEAQGKRYARMQLVYRSALRHLNGESPEAPEPQAVLRELGREALEENADWVMLHRDRPIEPPGPGH